MKDATVWWIEDATGELWDKRFSSPPRVDFEAEVVTKYATNPIDILVITDQWADTDGAVQALERLKEKSFQLRSSKQ